jgi:hypothetical protein
VGLSYIGAQPARLATTQPTWAFRPEAESRGALSPIGTGGLPAGSRWSWGPWPRSTSWQWGLRWGLGDDGRLTRESGGGEVLGRWVHTGERSEEQPRVPVGGSRQFMTSVRSSRRCREVQRGTRPAVHGGSMMASTAAQWRQRGGGGKRVFPRGGGCSFYIRWRRWAKAAWAAGGAVAAVGKGSMSCGRSGGGGEAVGTTKWWWWQSVRVAPLSGQGG